MRYSIFILLVIGLFSCKQKNNHQPIEKTLVTNFDWLLGDWERVDEKEGNKTYEYWSQKSDIEYIGMGCTLKGVDTIWREDILLVKKNDEWNFEVIGLGDSTSTVFKLTEIGSVNFVCENDLNEFPKKIEYAFDGKNINAVISGGGPTIPFNFIPLKR